jgi:hypothetical protein
MTPVRANIVGQPSVTTKISTCRLPFRGLMNQLRKLRDVVAGVLERGERGYRAAARAPYPSSTSTRKTAGKDDRCVARSW